MSHKSKRHKGLRPQKKTKKLQAKKMRAHQTSGGGRRPGPRTDHEVPLMLEFSAIDTWFFKEARPHNGVGAAELGSLFPPPARTLSGALRTLVGETEGVDWGAYRQRQDHPLRKRIGFGDDLGPLRLSGPWLLWRGQPLYPCPALLLAKGKDAQRAFARLHLGAAVQCDLGRVHLPVLADGARDLKPLERAWLTKRGLRAVLAGGTPRGEDVLVAEQLYCEEPRLGIARNPASRTAAEHMLYQTRHLRPAPGLRIGLGVEGLDPADSPREGDMVRLGGEGRLAGVRPLPTASVDPMDGLTPAAKRDAKGLILVLLSAADLDGTWLPPGFTPVEKRGVTTWRGSINEVELTIHGAIAGRAQRQGGWDQAHNRPRPVRSLLPAGSLWYCTPSETDLPSAMAQLYGARIGLEQELGRGLLAAGLWPRNESVEEEEQTP